MIHLSRISQRRWSVFLSRRLAVASAAVLLVFSFLSFTAELWSNDRPLALHYRGEWYFPAWRHYPPSRLGIKNAVRVDYKKLGLRAGDFALWPLNRWSPLESNKLTAEYPAPPSRENWLGTDDRGRDIFARLLYGFRESLVFALSVWAISSALGLFYGGICGYLGGWVDLLGQRACEVLSTLPQLLLLIFLVSVLEPSLALLTIVSSAFGWIGLSYFVRGEVLRTRNLEFVTAARALGATEWHVFCRHVLPNCIVPLLTFAPFVIIANISSLAALDYMGLGLPPPTPSWGELLQQAQNYFSWAWWLGLFPSLAMFGALLSLTLLGEGIRVAFDPSAEPPPSNGDALAESVREPIPLRPKRLRAAPVSQPAMKRVP